MRTLGKNQKHVIFPVTPSPPHARRPATSALDRAQLARPQITASEYSSTHFLSAEAINMSSTIPPIPNAAAPAIKATNAAAASLSPTDFLNMMVTQLQNQDPLNPTSSSDLLAQMSQIGQLQASTTLQSSL